MKPLILITRAIEHALQTQKDVQALGYDTLLDPLMDIQPIADVAPIPATTAALIITSRNALAGFKLLQNNAEFPMFIVGKETAALFAAAGFKNIIATAEQSGDLPRLIKASVKPASGALIHITSEHAHTEFYDVLLDAGYGIDQRLVYTANAAQQFSDATLAAFKEGKLNAVLFYSARTAEIFNTLVATAGQTGALKRMTAICLSDAVAAALDKTAHKTTWKSVVAAKSPTHQSLMDCLAKGL